MANRKKGKIKKTAAGYIEKISSQISDRIKKELEKSFKVTPSGNMKSIKKKLAGLKKQIKNRLKKELKKSFKLTPSDTIKNLPKMKKQVKKRLKEELKRSFRVMPR